MKKIISIVLVITTLLLCTSCGKKDIDNKIEVSQMEAICELATLKCYYHIVEKYNKENVEGLWFWVKDRHFWVECSGIVTMGVDASKLEIKIKDNLVTIGIPEATVQGCEIDDASLTKDSIIVDKESADVKAEHQIELYSKAKERLKEGAQNDKALLEQAKSRAKKMLENYVHSMGELTGIEYEVKFVDVK